jgi:phage shock protein C
MRSFFKRKSITKIGLFYTPKGHYKLLQYICSDNQCVDRMDYKLFDAQKTCFPSFGVRNSVYFCAHELHSAKDGTKNIVKMEKKKLYRSMTDKKLCGVCGGIAEYFEIDPTLVRLLWVCASLFSACFPGLLAYIICAIVVPQQNQLPNP